MAPGGTKTLFEVKLTFEMLTVHRQQHSFLTHERVFLWKCQSFWDRKCLDLRGTRTPNLRIHAECSFLSQCWFRSLLHGITNPQWFQHLNLLFWPKMNSFNHSYYTDKYHKNNMKINRILLHIHPYEKFISINIMAMMFEIIYWYANISSIVITRSAWSDKHYIALDSFTVPLHSPNSRHLPAVRAVQGDFQWPLQKRGNFPWSHEVTMHCDMRQSQPISYLEQITAV